MPYTFVEMYAKAIDLETNCFAAKDHTAFCQGIFNICLTRRKATINLNAVEDHFSKVTKPFQAA